MAELRLIRSARVAQHDRAGEQPLVRIALEASFPVSSVPTPDVTLKRSVKRPVDFYSTGNDAFFLSERLVALIDRLDPGSLERRPVTIRRRRA